MDLSIFFAGTGGSVPSARRGLPAVLIRRGGERVLFDCGEGTQRQLIKSVGLADVDAVFITHFHADHWLGLPGMLKSFALRERTRPLGVYGPRGLGELMEKMRFVYGRRLPYELSVVELAPAETVARDGYLIGGDPGSPQRRGLLRVRARGGCPPGAPRSRAGAEQLGVKPGPDFGRLQRGETVGGVHARAGDGPERRRAQARHLRRHRAVRGAGGRRARGRRARARGDVRRGGVRAGAPDLPQHRAPGGRAGARGARCDLLALTHISSRYRRR